MGWRRRGKELGVEIKTGVVVMMRLQIGGAPQAAGRSVEISRELWSIGMGLGPISRWPSMKGKAEQMRRREHVQ